MSLDCLMEPFSMQDYGMMQVMKFTVDEINNSSTLLPNITLGYEIFDVCDAAHNFPSMFNFISINGRIKLVGNRKNKTHNVIGVVGPSSSSDSLTMAPVFMMDLVPMISYAASSSRLSNTLVYPSFLRTIPTNKDIIRVIVRIIQHFGWNWVAFIGAQGDEYSRNGLELFRKQISSTSICLAYFHELETETNYEEVLDRIDSLNINVIVVFTLEDYARDVINTAIRINMGGKVWIAGDSWSMDHEIATAPGIEKIGTVFGVTDRTLNIPGLRDFIYKSRFRDTPDECVNCEGGSDGEKCNQACDNCTSLNIDAIINDNPTFSFSVYAAVYTMAHALNTVLNCSKMGCNKVQELPSYLLLQHMLKANFSLLNRQIRYDENGDPPASFSVVLWRPKKVPPFQIVGTYEAYPTVRFTMHNDLVVWYDNGTVPFSNCSEECESGFERVQNSVHQCCFQCEKCPANTYVNVSVDFDTCASCQEGEWSDEGSTYCTRRSIIYLQYTDSLSILFLICAASFMLLSLTISILFAFNYNTPVVKSAGGSMCFLMLACLILSNVGVFFYFGVPRPVDCVMRNIFFIFFFTVCLSCMAVRSFQIVSVFKMAAKFPKAYGWWVKYNGQWLCLAVYTVLHLIACGMWLQFGRPKPYVDDVSFKDQTVLTCDIGTLVMSIFAWFFLWFLSVVCFCFSYMGKDLPKNYNEAKSITFSLVLFYLGWIAYFTAYIVSRGVYVQLLNAAAQLSSAYGIIISFFIPRTYIIIFQPNKNTQAYFQTKIQTYTQTISRMYQFDESSYQMFQVMRFAVEEINNSTTLLPNVSLGYEIFDHCSDTQNFPSVFSFMSQNGSFPVLQTLNSYQPKVIAVTGPYESTSSIAVAPLFMMDLIPMLLRELKNSNFSLNGRQVKYDDNGDPPVSFAVVQWRPESSSPLIEVVGSYDTYPETTFTINDSLIHWDDDGSVRVPFGNCSVECKEGYVRERDQNHECCFQCQICPINTYVNHTQDPYTCIVCDADDWAREGSTFCIRCDILYLSFTDPLSVLLLLCAASLVLLCTAITVLFLYHYNTPVVKSAGGNLCFLMLVSLIMSSVSLFFFFGRPTPIRCVFRNVMFFLFYAVCISCLSVRSFQIFCVFNLATRFPEAYKSWMRYNGQWLVIGTVTVVQLVLCVLWVTVEAPAPFRDEVSFEDLIILGCTSGNTGTFLGVVFVIFLLSLLCFTFSYMCADLPKNYNEAKSITFSILLCYIGWCLYFTGNLISKAVYIQYLYVVAQLSSLYGLLLSYFIPKSYIIVFQPQKNTQAYFQTSIQNYTQNISRT
ncbi:hypothetical protein NFI96_011175 [Prochilodus magdalenae]|nr:hypothetical protein NFI96_011175 [Prochilodus magdalenae]